MRSYTRYLCTIYAVTFLLFTDLAWQVEPSLCESENELDLFLSSVSERARFILVFQ